MAPKKNQKATIDIVNQQNSTSIQLTQVNSTPALGPQTITIHQSGHMQVQHNQTVTNVTTLNLPNVYSGQVSTPHMSWQCELCGKILPNREEWSIHAKSHLEVI